ncbi:methyltransferase domain-containing protein [Paraburkholderia sp. MM5477-R1]|uniref:class I SAM-dependent methyltransferase n=1 Tax=Paraburkholderia sp. MM5477-R1 TaxID=2991062 RepID=UPI003D1A16F3
MMRTEDSGRELRRKRLLSGLDISGSTGVEIGALCWPLVRRSDGGTIIYVDHTDTGHLRQKYRDDPHVVIDEIVDVDAIWGENTLHEAIGGRYVDYVVASHVVEHVPDLVTWLRELGAVLKPTGEVRLVVPDRRFTFDYFRRESRLPEVLASYVERARAPRPYSLLDYCLNAADVSTVEAWQKRIDRPSARLHHNSEGAIHLARDAYENGSYHDVHCWVFTPRSFAELMGDLCQLGLLDFACEHFRDTAKNDLEFSVVLRRSHDKGYIAESWQRMWHAASTATPGVPFWRVRRKLAMLGATGGVQTASGQRTTGQPSDLDAVVPLVFPPGFVAADYLAMNHDVRDAGADPVVHYRHYGWHEGRPIRPPASSALVEDAHPPAAVAAK